MSDTESDDAATHAATMQSLNKKDPDFYHFLMENDKDLLEFEPSDEEMKDDVEKEQEKKPSGPISLEKFKFIQQNIRTSPTVQMCKELIRAFRCALQQAEGTSSKIIMANSELFNGIVKLCLIDLVPALQKVMKLSSGEGKKMDPTKSRFWKKMETCVKRYLIDMVKMISVMNSSSIRVLLLMHTMALIPFYKAFPLLSRHLVKKVILLWSNDEETVRILALMVIVRISKTFSKKKLATTLKKMYIAFIRNCKFTSPSTWPVINFMKRSLAEIYSMNPDLAYQHSFVYIRQMCIHLRNARTTKKEEACRTVNNWQFVHCICFWSHLLCRLHDSKALETVLYPMVQFMQGTIGLNNTAEFLPLRVHLIKELIHISDETNAFIPVLPLILEILKIVDYNKKSNFSIKPVDFTVALKVTKSQLQEAGFKDACISEVCNLLVEYLKIYCSSCAFPELTLPAYDQIKSFMKQCKVSKYNQQLKAILTKVEENCHFINEKRKTVTFNLKELDQVKRWEDSIHNQGPPMLKKSLR